MMSRYFCCCFLLFFLIACKQKESPVHSTETGVRQAVYYAKGFTITQFSDYKELVVRDPLDTNKILQKYHLYHDSNKIKNDAGAINIKVPINNLASLSTTHLGFLEALNVTDKLIAFSGTKYIYSPLINQLVQEGKIKEAGIEGGLDLELLVSLQPDIIMSYATGDESYDHFEKMKRMQLIPVINNEYRELSPLGQAEWIKFIAAFFDLEKEAVSIFDSITTNYNKIKSQVAAIENKPTVFTGLAYKNEWTVPGGKSFAANYLKDAGADYIWQQDDKTGNYALSFEEIFSAAKNADYWLNVSAATSLAEIKKMDSRNTYFDPFIHAQVYNNYARVNSNGGNDYWESAIVYPDRVLMDLVKIFHPELNLGDNYYYYIKLL